MLKRKAILTKAKWGLAPAGQGICSKLKNLIVATVSGAFRQFESGIHLLEERFVSVDMDVWVAQESFETGDPMRELLFKIQEVFHSGRQGEINFVGDRDGKSQKAGIYELSCDLTLSGVTRRIRLDVQAKGLVKDTLGNDRVVFSVFGLFSRGDWDSTRIPQTKSARLLTNDGMPMDWKLQLSERRN